MTSTTFRPRHRSRPSADRSLQSVASDGHARTVARAKDREARLRERLQQLARSSRQRAKEFQRLYLASHDAMISAVAKANKKHRLPPEELLRLAAELSAWIGTDEPVNMWPKRKSNGGHRPITAFGIQNRALQILAHRAVKPLANLAPDQYVAAGRGGNDVACQKILQLLGRGFTHVLLVDVADNFNTMGAEGVVQMLPLPERITRAVALAGGLNFDVRFPVGPTKRERRCKHRTRRMAVAGNHGPVRPPNYHHHPTPIREVAYTRRRGTHNRADEVLKKGQRGISQGSALSSLASEILHAPIVRKVSEHAPVVHYVDDYHVFARTEDELLPIAETLQAEFSQHPAGPLLPKQFIIKDARRGFVALGWLFKVRDGRVSIRPPRHKLENCLKNFDKKLHDAVTFGKGTPEDARQYLRGWCESHRLWPHVRLWEVLLLRRLDRAVASDRHGA